jgi:hypothetical protein
MPPPNTVLRSPIRLAQATNVLLGLAAATDLLGIYSGVVRHQVTGDLLTRSSEDISRSDDLYELAGTLQMCVAVTTAILFLTWFHRVRANADVFAQDVCTRGRGWSVGGWFIPVGNLWIPFTVAREIWTASAQSAPDGSWREVSAAPIKRWWTVWVAALVTLRLGTQWSDHAKTPAALQHSTDLVMLADALLLAAALLAIVFVRKLTAMQHTKALYGPVAAESPAQRSQQEARDAADLAELEAMEAALRAEQGLPAAAQPVRATPPPGGWLPCPACGHQMFSDWWSHEICDVCRWQDDQTQLRYPWSPIGPNGGVSLIEAQANVQRIGAVREDQVRHMRPAAADEPLDPGWRPIDPQRDAVEAAAGEAPYPDDLTELYWWRPTYWRRHLTPTPPL